MKMAHRGFRQGKNENTFIEFNNALKYTNAVELDIRLTSDMRIIIFHDASFKRIANVRNRVKHTKYSDIQHFDFYKRHPNKLPPLLKDFLAIYNDKYQTINIEIKNDDYNENEISYILEQIKLWTSSMINTNIIVSSFSQKISNKMLVYKNSFKIGYLIGNKRQLKISNQLSNQYHYLSITYNVLKRKKMSKTIKSMNKPILVWTIKNQKQINKIKYLYSEHIQFYIMDKKELKI